MPRSPHTARLSLLALLSAFTLAAPPVAVADQIVTLPDGRKVRVPDDVKIPPLPGITVESDKGSSDSGSNSSGSSGSDSGSSDSGSSGSDSGASGGIQIPGLTDGGATTDPGTTDAPAEPGDTTTDPGTVAPDASATTPGPPPYLVPGPAAAQQPISSVAKLEVAEVPLEPVRLGALGAALLALLLFVIAAVLRTLGLRTPVVDPAPMPADGPIARLGERLRGTADDMRDFLRRSR